MTEKPKFEDLIEKTANSMFDQYAKDWAGDHDSRLWDEIDEEEAREWRETAKELLTPAYEQGKLDLVELLEKGYTDAKYPEKFAFRAVVEWLKSQISKGAK
jgi:hypothetical protein